MSSRIFAIADIHGEMEKLLLLMHELTSKANFVWGVDELVQLGDKNDRGPNTFEVFDWWKEKKALYPNHVHLCWGNHERLMLDSALAHTGYGILAESNIMGIWTRPGNGGKDTIESYSKHTRIYGKGGWPNSLLASRHLPFLKEEHVLFMETDEYFFCHAPIPLERPDEWQTSEEVLTWSHGHGGEQKWVDPDPLDGKICVYGHVHGIEKAKSRIAELVFGKAAMTSRVFGVGEHAFFIPGARRIGNAILLDSGCGCHPDAPLSAIELPSLQVFTSNGETFSLSA